jgi:hypothetical protein
MMYVSDQLLVHYLEYVVVSPGNVYSQQLLVPYILQLQLLVPLFQWTTHVAYIHHFPLHILLRAFSNYNYYYYYRYYYIREMSYLEYAPNAKCHCSGDIKFNAVMYRQPVTVAERSKAYTFFARSLVRIQFRA